jgi:hypothetical protein
LSKKTFRLRLSRVAINRSFTGRTESMTLRAWWSGLGDSVGSELYGFSIGFKLGIALLG